MTTMACIIAIVISFMTIQTMVMADDVETVLECGPANQSFAVAGSSTVYPLAVLWADAYMKLCPTISVKVESGGSSSGAARVCGSESASGEPVDIGDMSRNWYDTESVVSSNRYLHQCIIGNPERSAIQIDVAVDGLSVAALQNGTAATCIELLGGLTTDQLRWIFSNYDADELLATGWDSSSLSNSDGDETTRLWSELDARCAPNNILIAGADPDSGTFEYFLETILVDLDSGETFDPLRPGGYFNSTSDEEIVIYTEENEDCIAFFGYAYFLKDSELLYAVPIQNDEGEYVEPNPETVADGSYNPLSRRIYMNLLNDADSLDNTRPFIHFAFSPNGTDLVDDTGYVPIEESERLLLLERIPGPGESIEVTPISLTTAPAPSTPLSPSSPTNNLSPTSSSRSRRSGCMTLLVTSSMMLLVLTTFV